MAQMPDSFKPIDMPDSFQPISVSEEPKQLEPSSSSVLDTAKSIWDTANRPLIDIRSGGLKTASDEFAAEHPYIGKPMNFLTDTLSSLTSPLSLGLGALTAGSSLAESVGLPELAKTLEIPGRVTAGGMIGHGGYNLVRPSATPEERAGGLLEAGLGALGVRGSSKAKVPGELARVPSVEVPKVTPEVLQGDLPLQAEQASKINSTLEAPKPTEATPAVAKLQAAIEDIKPLNKQQQQIYSLERSERLGKMKGVTTPGEAGFKQQLGELKGPMDKVTFEPIKLEQPDVDELFDTISNHPASIGYNEIKAKTGLTKILSGQVPQKNEIDLLNQVFGNGVTDNLIKNMPAIDKAGGLISEVVNLPKSLMASFDMSAPFRQGLGLAHKKEFWTSFDDMVRSFGSENAFNAIQEGIVKSPNFQLSQDAGLHLSSLTNMTNREEAFMSSWAERFPGVGRVVRASDRAYVGFLNKLRSDTFNSLIENAESAAKSLELTAKTPAEIQAAKLANPKTNAVLAEEFANFVNTATGRGSLGKLEPSAVALNNMFFSPRLIASRVRMLNPQTYISASPAVRKEYLKSLLAIATVGATVTGLGKAAGGETSGELTSSDAGKIRFGDTRLDPYGGFQQYIVAANRLLSGQSTSSTSGNTYDLGSKYGLPTRFDVLKNFTANKLSPVAKFAYDLLNANKQQPFSFSDESASLFIPMVMRDVLDLAVTNPKLIPTLGPASALGMGVQTYPQPGPVTQIEKLLQR